jgi:prevent-host-death family protein
VFEPQAAASRRYSGWLQGDGFDVEAAASESDALRALTPEAPFRLVVATVKARTGAAVIERLRRARPDLPIVAITGDNATSVAALERGALQCLVSPVAAAPLTRLIALVLKGAAAPSALAHRAHPRPNARTVSATDAKNEFASLLETAVARGPVLITKHDTPRAVLLAAEEFDALSAAPSSRLSVLTAAFDSMLDRMQQSGARARMQAAFDATPEELGAAAVRAARPR